MANNNEKDTMKTNFSESAFDAVLKNIKLENDHCFNGELSDSEDSASIDYKSIDNKGTKQQNEMYESASTSFERNADDESKMQEHTDTEIVDGETISMHASSSKTALRVAIFRSITMPIFTSHTCHQCCSCDQVFGFIDRPSHIGEIPSIDEQNIFLKLSSSLSVNSCFCALCWKLLIKYKIHRSSGNCVLQNISSNETLAKKCSIRFCTQYSYHKMSVDQCELINKFIPAFKNCGLDFLQSKNKSSDFLTFPFCLCEYHSSLIFTMLSCQICNSIINEPFNTDDCSMYKKWNMSVKNNFPLLLQPNRFICMTCKENISKINVSENNAARLELYGKSQYNFNIRQRSNVASPIVFAKIKDENDYVRSAKVKFSDPLTTATYHYEYDYDKNDTESVTSSALLNVGEQNLCTPKLEPIDEEQHLQTFTPSNHVLGHDDNKDLLQTDDHQLKNYEINQYPEIVQHNLPKTQCQIDNIEIVKNEPEIIDSRQVISVHYEIENNQSRLNSHILSSGAQDKSSTELKEGNQCMNEINTNYKTVNLNEADNKMYSFIAAVEPPNPVSIKRKQNNIICPSISNKNAKKQRLNENYSSCDNNFTNNCTTKSNRNKNIPHPSIISPSILNMISKNQYVLNSELIGVQDLSNYVDKESLKVHGNSMKDIELKTNVPSIEIIKTYDSNPSCSTSSSLQFQRVFKNNSTWMEPIKSSIKREINFPLDQISDTESIPETITLSDSENLLDSEIRVSDTESFSDSDEDEILTNFYTEEKDFMVVVSEGDLDSDSDCEIIPNPEIETNYKFLSHNENSVDVDIISNDKNVFECTTLLDSAKDSNCEISSEGIKKSRCIIVSDTGEKFHSKKISTFKVIKTGSDSEILMNHAKIIETYIKTKNRKVNYIVAFENEIKPSGDKVSTCIVISDNTTGFNNKKLSTYKINVEKGSDCKIFLDGEKVKIMSEKDNKNVIEFNGEMEHSDNVEFKCIIISDSVKEYTNKNISTFKIVSNVQKNPACEILNGKEIFGIESGNRKIKYMILSDEPNSDERSQYMISDDGEDFINKKLSALKILKKNIQKGSDSVLLGGEEFHKILPNSENGRIKCMIAPDCEIESDSDEQSNNEEIFSYKKVSDVIITSNGTIEVDDSQGELSDDEEEFHAKTISDIIITPNSTIQVDDSQSLKTLDDNNSINNSKINSDKRSLQLQIKSGHSFPYLELTANENRDHDDEKYKKLTDYFQPYLAAIAYYFENADPSLKELYIQLGSNEMNMLLYLMENYRMYYNGDLSISDTADEFSRKYLTEQKEILSNYFGNPDDSINASKPFIHPSSHLHKYSKRLSPKVEPIKDITITTGSPVQNNSIASKVQTPYSAYAYPNIQLPVAIKRKTVSKNKLKNTQLQ